MSVRLTNTGGVERANDTTMTDELQANPCVSVVVRVRNAAGDLQRCLQRLREQTLPAGRELEIVVVDNESTDDSADVARRYDARIVSLSRAEFSWGRALNRGIAAATGEMILLLSADACPVDAGWLLAMLEPFEDDKVAAVYGRQVPRSDAPIDEVVRLQRTFPEQSVRQTLEENCDPSGRGMIVSNACAAIRRRLWEQSPYDEEIQGGEEGVWTYQALQAGYCFQYQAEAQVYHSHNDSAFRQACRLIELMQKNCEIDGRRFSLWVLFRGLAAYSKRRLKNCLFARVACLTRLKGVLRLPLEVAAVSISFGFLKSPWFGAFRDRVWG